MDKLDKSLKSNYTIWIILLLIVIVLLIIIKLIGTINNKKYNNINNHKYNLIPKKIWTYWHDPNNIPKTVKLCMESWKKYNPNYEITLITKENYKKHVYIPKEIEEHKNFHDGHARFSDLIRLYVLSENGGVWIDSSILINSQLDDWLFTKYAEFSGFYIEGFTKKPQYPVIENWFFACNKNSEFVRKWRDEFSEISKFENVDKYIESRKGFVDTQGINSLNYLAIHVSAQKVLQKDKYPLNNLILKKAEDGPYSYLVDSDWNSEKALKLACKNRKYHKNLMKIRSCERSVFESKIDNELSNEKCNWF